MVNVYIQVELVLEKEHVNGHVMLMATGRMEHAKVTYMDADACIHVSVLVCACVDCLSDCCLCLFFDDVRAPCHLMLMYSCMLSGYYENSQHSSTFHRLYFTFRWYDEPVHIVS